MQLDMHYYGTYALARAAGLNKNAAKMIATCAQFVDDNTAATDLEFDDGARIDSEATAHHALNKANLDPRDQRRVWVPFHFLPGNQGKSYTERLKCRIDSEIAQEMRDHHLSLAERPFSLALIGIAAHVYADTFSHYGFSGVSSRGNRVDAGTFKFHEEVQGLEASISKLKPKMREYVTQKAKDFFDQPNEMHGGFWENIVTRLGEAASGALGHGSVATYPDRPYLVWSYEYERDDFVIGGKTSVRNNPVTFLRGCRALHEMFRRYAIATRKNFGSGDARDFDSIAQELLSILTTQGDEDTRIAAWQEAAADGTVFGAGNENIPVYNGELWNDEWNALDGKESYRDAIQTPIWYFYQAASLHRTYVLRDLLPKHDLIVS